MKKSTLFSRISSHHKPKTSKGKAKAIRNTVVDLLLKGLTRKEIISGYRSIGLGVSNDTFNKIFKDIRPSPVGEGYFKSLKANDKPDLSQFATSNRSFFAGNKYRFIGSMKFRDGNEIVIHRMAVDLDEVPTVGEIRDYLLERLCDSDYRYCENIISVTLVGAYYNG